MLSAQTEGLPDLQRAIERYGLPVEREYLHQVSKTTFRYWQLVRRKRVSEVVLLLRRRSGLYLVHAKGFYPEGTYRLLSGGVKPGEELTDAVGREALEETCLEVSIESFLAILRHQFIWKGQSLPFVSYLFEVAEKRGTLAFGDPDEDISGFREVTLEQVSALAEKLESLPPDWVDWGRFRATAHRLVGELLLGERRRS